MDMLTVPLTTICGEKVCLIKARKAESIEREYGKDSLRLGESLDNSRPTTLKQKPKCK